MSETILTRADLEKLSLSQLSRLADEYGIDVPENLDRRFLIAELIDVQEDYNNSSDEMIISSADSNQSTFVLPKNYNETQVSGVLRNPGWLFVYWNMSDSDSLMLKSVRNYELRLRICCLENAREVVPEEAFEVLASTDAQEQYVLLPAGKKFLKVELVYVAGNTGKVLAFSPVITIPQGSSLVSDLQMGRDTEFSDILKLSEMGKVVTEQYTNHRHSFS